METATLDILSSFAAYASAFAIAYASLPNFRHRRALKEYVQERVKGSAVFDAVSKNPTIRDGADWSVLYRLGNLREIDDAAIPQGKGDRHFNKRTLNSIYSILYASNLDKLLAVAMGAISGSVVWLSTVDHIRFPAPEVGYPDRTEFLIGTLTFYAVCGALAVLGTIIHVFVWTWDMKPDCWRVRLMNWTCRVIFVIFVCMSVAASIGNMPFPVIGRTVVELLTRLRGWQFEVAVLHATNAMSMLILSLTLALLYFGERLHVSMTGEADVSYANLKDQVAGIVAQAKIAGAPIAKP